MQTIYNSPLYCVVRFSEFERADPRQATDGFEIMDKTLRREIFLHGKDADQFRHSVERLMAGEVTDETMDDFLAGYRGLMTTPLALH